MGCTQTEKTLGSKKNWGLGLVCIGILMMMIYAATLTKMINLDVINEKLFDLKLITVNDFTVKFKVTKDMFDNFKRDKEHKIDDTVDVIQRFEENVSKKIEQQMEERLLMSPQMVEIADL